MHRPAFRVPLVALVLAACVACSRPPITEEPLFREPVTDLSRVLTKTGVEFDTGTTSDGNGSIEISAADSTTVRLYGGQNPDHIPLNVVVTGPGTVWVDDITLIKTRR